MGFIDKPRQVWWRKVVFQVHLWVGLLVALYVVVISATGCALILCRQICDDAPLLTRKAAKTNPETWTTLIANAELLHPGYKVILIEADRNSSRASRLLLARQPDRTNQAGQLYRDIYFDPSTGHFLKDQQRDSQRNHPIHSLVANLHFSLLAGQTGRRLNSIGAAFLLVLCISGGVIWWPGSKTWRQALTLRRKTSWKRCSFDLHRSLGFWTLGLIAAWALTGLYFGLGAQLQKNLSRLIPAATPTTYPQSHWKPDEPMVPIAELYANAQLTLPGYQVDKLSFPRRSGDSVHVSLTSKSFPQYLHNATILLDPTTGSVLYSRDEWKQSKPSDLIARSLISFHTADFRSIPLELFLAAVGLSPAVLMISGALMWWNRVLRKRWKTLSSLIEDQIHLPPPQSRLSNDFPPAPSEIPTITTLHL